MVIKEVGGDDGVFWIFGEGGEVGDDGDDWFSLFGFLFRMG